MKSDKVVIFLYFVVLFFVFARPSYAYLDPGTGSYLFQLVIAGFLGGSIFFRSTAKKVKKLFKSKKEAERKKNNRDR